MAKKLVFDMTKYALGYSFDCQYMKLFSSITCLQQTTFPMSTCHSSQHPTLTENGLISTSFGREGVTGTGTGGRVTKAVRSL